ncbi:MAG: hypothetical protein E2O39_08725 [Planctomycetota bacterium]|nr:MAG: hypothetical protein E2O39_08725 [Planctomycetota bacterium]
MPEPPIDRRPPRKTMGTDLTPLYMFVVLIGGGIAAAGWLFGRKQELKATETRVAAEAEEVDPFAHIPDELPPRLRRAADERARVSRNQPAGIEAEPAWIEAQELADKGWTYAAEAEAAEAEGRTRTLGEQSAAARAAFARALEITAEWELVLIEKHGERDPLVRRVVRTRAEWADALRSLSETKDR